MNSIEYLLDLPARHGEREFLVDTISGERHTYASLHECALNVAADLRQRGLQPGDRVALLLHNSAAFVKLYLGCLYARLVTVPINPVFSATELSYILQTSRCKLLVLSPETMDQVRLGGDCPEVLLLQDGRSKIGTTRQLWVLDELAGAPHFVPLEQASPDDTMTIVFTSGTTASPTGVVHRISDLVDNARLFNQRLGIGPENRFYGILAMTYLGGYYNLLLIPYVAGGSLVLSNAFDARAALDFWGPARTHGVNTLWLVPTIIAILMEMDRGTAGADFCRQSIRLGLVGTASLPPAMRKDFERKYGVELFENYGLSETLFITTNSPATPVVDGSVGHTLPGVQITVVDEQGRGLPAGSEGEVWACTPYLMEGVLCPETGQPALRARENWYATGDLGIISATGELSITGRKKDLIIRGGINISPAAIENVVQRHPNVLECAVVGVPHSMYGEEIAAVVRLQEPSIFAQTRTEILKSCRESLGSVRQPHHLIEIDEFPRSSTGKIRKRDLREMVASKLGVALPTRATATTSPANADRLPAQVRRTILRPDAGMVRELAAFSTSLISDCLNRFGCMDGSLRPMGMATNFCGPAVTVEESEGGNLMSHLALELIEAGDVLVIDAKGTRTRSCWGGLQTLMASQRGLAAVVVHGAVRDLDEIASASLPVFAQGVSPAGPLKAWGGNINFPLACAGLSIRPGDVVAGDLDGLVVVPAELLEPTLKRCHQRKHLEAEWRSRVEKGESTLEVVNLQPRLKELGVEFL